MTKVECSDCEEEHRAASAKETKAPETQTNPEPEPDTHVEVEPARGDRNQRRELYSWYCSRLLLRCEAPEPAAILPGSKSGTTAWYCGPTRIPPPPARTHTHTHSTQYSTQISLSSGGDDRGYPPCSSSLLEPELPSSQQLLVLGPLPDRLFPPTGPPPGARPLLLPEASGFLSSIAGILAASSG